MTEYPFVGGHEVVGKVAAMGENVKGLSVGDTVGLGWNAETCGHCDNCISGFQINCPNLVGTIVEQSRRICRKGAVQLGLGGEITRRDGRFKSRTAFLRRHHGF